MYYLRKSDLVWTSIRNAVTPTTLQKDEVIWPRGILSLAALPNSIVEEDNYKMLNDGTIASSVRANVTKKIYPSLIAKTEQWERPFQMPRAEDRAHHLDAVCISESEPVSHS